jgi:hypothetical protein
MNFQHCGLYFSDDHVLVARKNKKRSPLNTAWDDLLNREPSDALSGTLWQAFRYRFNANLAAGERVVNALNTTTDMPSATPDVLALLQAFELVRDHPGFEVAQQTAWLDGLVQRITHVRPEADAPIVDQLWMAALDMAAGIALEREDWVQTAVSIVQQTVETDIHPEGYLPRAVERTPEAQGLENQLQAAQILTLMAEMSAGVGVDLWGYAVRGVTVRTATTYPLYYYFYPEQWPWSADAYKPSEGVAADTAAAIFQRHQGFLEMANRRYDTPLKAIQMILDDLRPVFDLQGGGLTTLSHAVAKRSLFG